MAGGVWLGLITGIVCVAAVSTVAASASAWRIILSGVILTCTSQRAYKNDMCVGTVGHTPTRAWHKSVVRRIFFEVFKSATPEYHCEESLLAQEGWS